MTRVLRSPGHAVVAAVCLAVLPGLAAAQKKQAASHDLQILAGHGAAKASGGSITSVVPDQRIANLGQSYNSCHTG